MPASSEELPPEIIAPLLQHAFVSDQPRPTYIPVYCNVCDHEIRRHGNDWRCVTSPPCRCLMIGCTPKIWSTDDDD